MSGQGSTPGRLAIWPFGRLAGNAQQTGARRRLAGARAQGSGAAFETWLARYIFTPMTARGVLVRFDKLDPPSRSSWDASRQRAVMVPTGAGGGDWLLLAPGGRYIVCESKSTADARFYRAEI